MNFLGAPSWARDDRVAANGFTPAEMRSAAPSSGLPAQEKDCQHDGVLEKEDGTSKSFHVSSYVPDGAHWGAFGDFVAEFVKRYGPTATGGTYLGQDYGFVAVELWNEPNLSQFWGSFDRASSTNRDVVWQGPNPNSLANMIDRTGDSLQAAGLLNAVALLTPAMSPVGPHPIETLEDALRQTSYRSSIDGIAIHLYEDSISQPKRAIREAVDYADRTMAVRNEPDLSGMQDVGAWVTETGYPRAHLGVPQINADGKPDIGNHSNPQTQRGKFRRVFVQLADRNRYKAFIIHTLYDCGGGEAPCANPPTVPTDHNERGQFGTWGLPGDSSPRPIFCLLRDWAKNTDITGVSDACS